MAARGNRFGVGRFGVACLATVAVVLGVTQPALAMDATPPPPADTASTEAPATETTPPASEPTDPEPGTPPAEPTPEEPAAEEPAADPTPAPEGGTSSESGTGTETETTSTTTPDATSGPAETPTTAAPETAPADVVKLDSTTPQTAPAAVTAPAAPAAPAESAASAPPAAVETPAAPAAVSIVLLVEAPAAEEAAEADAPDTAAARAEAAAGADGAVVVSLRERAAAPLVALVPDDETANALAMPKLVVVSSKPKLLPRTCAQPRARVPLSQRCKQVRAATILRSPLTYSPSPEVRAAIDRVATRAAARRVEARPPPDSKAAKKHPVAEVRPTIPFGDSGQGAANDEFGGSTGSSWSSRLFAVTAVQIRVPMPFRFGRVRLPSTIPHGVIAAPPTARPG